MDLKEFKKVQNRLARRVSLKDGFGGIECIAGVDLAFRGRTAYCAAVVLDYDTLEPVEELVKVSKVSFPYVPTFLSFREADAIIDVHRQLKKRPDVTLIDGHGIAHPRGVGIASHVGVLLDRPTIGVAKNPLFGEVAGTPSPGKAVPLLSGKRLLGYALVTKPGTRPIYISPGNLVSQRSALETVRHCLLKHKLPEPSRLAHELANLAKEGIRYPGYGAVVR